MATNVFEKPMADYRESKECEVSKESEGAWVGLRAKS